MAFGGTLPAMSKDSREKATPKTEDGTTKLPGIPPEIGQLIRGRSVRIDPKRYFSKKFRAALPLIQHRLKESSPNTFTLESELFEDFVSSLRRVLETKADLFADFKASDWTSFVLLALAGGGEPEEFDYPDPEGYWEHISLPSSLIAPGNRPEATPPSGSDQQDSNKVSLNEGGLKITPAEKRALERRAKAIWSFLSDKISSRLGIARLEPGRSLTHQGELAAFAHDHRGYTWAELARELCKDQACKDARGNWKHSPWCRERYRKLAALYWKRETAKYAAMARERQTPQAPQTR